MGYTQLTREQRYQIYALLKATLKQTEIARIIGCHKSTITRELHRNRGAKGYRPRQADELAQQRQRHCHAPRISPQTWQQVSQLLRQQWSPEQIAGRLKLEKQPSVSHERIYRYIYEDKRTGGTLHRQLRCQKKHRKRYRSSNRRGVIPNRISIEKRPAIVASKQRLGDWEVDTIVGARHHGSAALLTFTERKSKLTLLAKLERKGAREITQAALKLLRPLSAQVHTITADNGMEFADHEKIAAGLRSRFYFAHPYASWERGLNENTNGLLRQYFPKNANFNLIQETQLLQVMRLLNNRPRKTLGYRTPYELFQTTVALLT